MHAIYAAFLFFCFLNPLYSADEKFVLPQSLSLKDIKKRLEESVKDPFRRMFRGDDEGPKWMRQESQKGLHSSYQKGEKQFRKELKNKRENRFAFGSSADALIYCDPRSPQHLRGQMTEERRRVCRELALNARRNLNIEEEDLAQRKASERKALQAHAERIKLGGAESVLTIEGLRQLHRKMKKKMDKDDDDSTGRSGGVRRRKSQTLDDEGLDDDEFAQHDGLSDMDEVAHVPQKPSEKTGESEKGKAADPSTTAPQEKTDVPSADKDGAKGDPQEKTATPDGSIDEPIFIPPPSPTDVKNIEKALEGDKKGQEGIIKKIIDAIGPITPEDLEIILKGDLKAFAERVQGVLKKLGGDPADVIDAVLKETGVVGEKTKEVLKKIGMYPPPPILLDVVSGNKDALVKTGIDALSKKLGISPAPKEIQEIFDIVNSPHGQVVLKHLGITNPPKDLNQLVHMTAMFGINAFTSKAKQKITQTKEAAKKIDLKKTPQTVQDSGEAQKRAEESKKQAEESKKKAEEAQKKAEESKKKAEEAQKAAEEAKGKEEAAQKAVEEAQKELEEAEKSGDPQKIAEAKKKLEAAQKDAEEAKKSSEEAKKSSEEAQKDAEAAQKDAEESRKASEEAQKDSNLQAGGETAGSDKAGGQSGADSSSDGGSGDAAGSDKAGAQGTADGSSGGGSGDAAGSDKAGGQSGADGSSGGGSGDGAGSDKAGVQDHMKEMKDADKPTADDLITEKAFGANTAELENVSAAAKQMTPMDQDTVAGMMDANQGALLDVGLKQLSAEVGIDPPIENIAQLREMAAGPKGGAILAAMGVQSLPQDDEDLKKATAAKGLAAYTEKVAYDAAIAAGASPAEALKQKNAQKNLLKSVMETVVAPATPAGIQKFTEAKKKELLREAMHGVAKRLGIEADGMMSMNELMDRLQGENGVLLAQKLGMSSPPKNTAELEKQMMSLAVRQEALKEKEEIIPTTEEELKKFLVNRDQKNLYIVNGLCQDAAAQSGHGAADVQGVCARAIGDIRGRIASHADDSPSLRLPPAIPEYARDSEDNTYLYEQKRSQYATPADMEAARRAAQSGFVYSSKQAVAAGEVIAEQISSVAENTKEKKK